ncbi:MAG: branched-chain amino acid transaminase [Endozoicomonadaceae bacterium]|nr:branched-chain amino acid transaminase [Endozoicomonadaceae bacterium]MCY4329632.1 branched-chain amino acid transaminase [Endozoicomonadaceae bacterium]
MSFLGQQNIIWFNGEFICDEKANISIASHTIHYGSGAFEGVRVYETERGPAIFRAEEHTQRLFNSARLIGMKLPFDQKTILRAQQEVIRRNHFSSAYLRPVVFYNDNSLGVYPQGNDVHVSVIAWDWKNYFGAEKDQGISVVTSTFKRLYPGSVFAKAKITGHYVNSILALQEAKRKGYQEAILFDCNGFIAEGSSANIFLVKNNILYTPTDANILPGITRDTIMALARDANYQVVEKNLTRDELYLADEIFFSGTASEVTPVSFVDDLPVGDGTTGPVTTEMRDAYFEVTHGKSHKYEHWNTIVE